MIKSVANTESIQVLELFAMEQSFTRSQLARLLNINKETLRFYENKGFVHPARAENGYRRYDCNDLRTLLDVAAFRSGGFSLEETHRIMFQQSLEENRAHFEGIVAEKREHIQQCLAALELFEQGMKPFKIIEEHLGRGTIRPLEEHYRVSISDSFEQMGLLSQVFVFDRYRLEDERAQWLEPLATIPAGTNLGASAQSLHPEGPPLAFPKCFYTVVEAAERTPTSDELSPVIAEARKRKLPLAGDIYTNYLAIAAGRCYCEVYLPIENGEKNAAQ